MAAVGLAERVASELGEEVGGRKEVKAASPPEMYTRDVCKEPIESLRLPRLGQHKSGGVSCHMAR